MPFAGFGKEALPFLKALGFHQTKEWFEANRSVYETALKSPLGDLVEDLTLALAQTKAPLKGDRKSSLFRINRDVRFSKDKSPYKTNAGAVLTRGGAKNDVGLFYFHLAPEGCFCAAGFYDPQPEVLRRLRSAMARDPKSWKAALTKLKRKGLEPSAEYALKRSPRGFESVQDEAAAAGVRLTSIVATRPIAEARLASAELVGDLVAFAEDAAPLLEWGWSAAVDSR